MPLTADELEHARNRRTSPYASSHPLEEIDVAHPDGSLLPLLLKKAELTETVKPAFLVDPDRERLVYEELLPTIADGAPGFHGEIDGALILERIDGIPLTQVGDHAVWKEAMRRLAWIHSTLRASNGAPLVRYDRALYDTWLDRARAFEPAVEEVASSHAAAVERLCELSQVVIHGELYAANVIVAGERISIIDWETAGLGPAVVDVAALTSGAWTDEKRESLALAYLDELPGRRPTPADFFHDLACARLHVAVQWLGWSDDWRPPPDQAQDWLGEARRAAARIR